ncbi:hydrogenase maturation protease [bacterium]|nr:hydrogenase maturation protease [bacterium]
MSGREKECLLLAMGRAYEGDESAGLIAARELARDFLQSVDIVESAEPAGIHLLDIMEGYSRALLLDVITTGHEPFGTIHEYSADDVCHEVDPSPHYEGLCDVLSMARRFEIPFPAEVLVLAIEIDPEESGGDQLSPEIEMAMPTFISRAARILEMWRQTPSLKVTS